MRLFTAIPIPEPVSKKLKEMQDTLLSKGLGGHRVPAENFHITVHFLGELDPGQGERVKKLMSSIHFSEELHLDFFRLGHLRSRKGETVVVDLKPTESLIGLFEVGKKLLIQEGFQIESRPYRPHVTIFRKAARIPKVPLVLPGSFTASNFSLMESQKQPRGVTYAELQSFRFLQS